MTDTDTVEVPKVEEPTKDEIIVRELPKQRGEFRRIHHIYGSAFRINFHDCETNCVVRSFFIHVIDGKVIRR